MNPQRNYLKKEIKMFSFDSDKEGKKKCREEKLYLKIAFFVGFSVPTKFY